MYDDEEEEGADQDDSQCPERPVTEAHMAAFFGAIGKEPPDSQVSSQTSAVPRSSKERKSGKHSWKLLGEQFSRGGEAFNLCHDEDLLIWSSSGSVCLFFFIYIYFHTVQSVYRYRYTCLLVSGLLRHW